MLKRFFDIFKGQTPKIAQKGVQVTDVSGQVFYRSFWRFFNDFRGGKGWGGYQSDLSDGFASNPYVYAVVDRIAKGVARIPVIAKRPKSDLPLNNETAARFLANPNTSETFQDFTYKAMVYLCSTGNCFILRERVQGDAVGFKILHAPSVQILTRNGKEDGPIYGYSYEGGMVAETDVLHLKFPDATYPTHWGASPLRALAQVIDGSNNTLTAGSHLRKNMGAMGMISSKNAEVPLTEKQRKEMEIAFNNGIGGPEKSGQVYFSQGAVEYTAFGMSPKDLMLEEARLSALRDVCIVFGVQPSIFGDAAASTYNNVSSAYRDFYKNVVSPLAVKYAQEFGAFILDTANTFGRVVADFSKVEEMQADPETKAAIRSDVQAGILTAAEARQLLYPELIIQSNEQ
jgi:HK97 family phage portal protein